jgi:hypothetical protein
MAGIKRFLLIVFVQANFASQTVGHPAFYVRVLRHLKALPPGTKSNKCQLLCANHNMIKRFDGGEALGRKHHETPWNPGAPGVGFDIIVA